MTSDRGGADFELRNELGQLIRVECKRRGISMAEAARRVGVARQELSYWVNGQRMPAPSHIPQLAKFLSMRVSEVRELTAHSSRLDRISELEQRVELLTELVIELVEVVSPRLDVAIEVARALRGSRAS